jgi:predicted MPP superfamily phosphohydrolase
MRLFFGIVMLVYTVLCVYTGSRLFILFRFLLPIFKAPVFWLPYVLLFYSLFFMTFLRHGRLPLTQRIGSYWLGILVYLFLSFIFFDIVRLVSRLFGKNTAALRYVIAAMILAFIVVIYGTINARSIRIVNYSVKLPGQGRDMRIALVSDLHIGPMNHSWLKRVVDIINKVQPDMVCIAGDIFDGHIETVKKLEDVTFEFARISAPLGVYACLGNHDVDRIGFSRGAGSERLKGILLNGNVTVLEDEVRPLGENLNIAGRRDARPIGMNVPRKSATELLAGLEGRTIIVLDHQPTQFAQIEEAGAALLLCGHTHRGQLFPANFITRSMFKKQGGTHYGYWAGRAMQAVVTSGAGLWGPPLRVATSNEVVVIDISFTKE